MNYTDPRPTAVCDTEAYIDYWSIGFQNVETKKVVSFEFYDGHPLDRPKIASILRKYRIVTFNGNRYDLPMIVQAMQHGVTNADLKRLSDDLIVGGLTPWRFYERSGLSVPDFIDHIDLIEVNPGAPTKPSLKLCGGRMHSRKIQDLPFHPSRSISEEDRVDLNIYLPNDLETTADLYFEVKPQLDLRARLSEKFGMDLRSKSDAQMAEAMIKIEVEKILKRRLRKPEIRPGTFKFDPPAWISFKTPQLQELFAEIVKTEFVIGVDGIVQMPKFLSDKRIQIGKSNYKMGIGGLHSCEESVTHLTDSQGSIQDNDVMAFYPNIICNTGLNPVQMGDAFMVVYKSMLDRRKKIKPKATAIKKRIQQIKTRLKELDA